MKNIGQQIKSSAEIDSLIQNLVNRTMDLNKKIQGPKESSPELTDKMQTLIDKASSGRGRPLFYPFIGSGAGNGPYVELEDGSVKIDLVNGIGINILGHSHPKLIEAGIRGSLEDIVVQGNLEPNTQYVTITERLLQLASKGTRIKHAWLSTCSSMTNENALKITRQKHNAGRMIIAMKNAFAGRSTMMAEITDNLDYKQGLPDYGEVLRVDFYNKNDPKSAEKSLNQLKEYFDKHKSNISCFTFEPMQGEGGYRVAPPEFFLPMLDFCKSKNIAVWADEVQTFARTGELFAVQTLGIGDYIDIITVAKSLKVGATLYTEEYNPKPGLIAGTFSGASAALSCGAEVLKILSEENYLGKDGKIIQIHNLFVSGLNRLAETTCKGLISEVEGMGLMIAFTPLDGSKENMLACLKSLFKNGLITFGCGHGPYRIRLLVPAIINEEEIEVALKIFEKSLNEVNL